MALFFIIFFAVYGSANFYLFLRGWQALEAFPAVRPVYAFIFILSASSYILTRVLNESLPGIVYDVLLWIGSLWFAFMLYFFLWVVLIDFIRLVNHFMPFFPEYIKHNYTNVKLITFLTVFVTTSLIVLAGYLNTRNINIKTLNITADKKGSSIEELNIVMASDFHLTPVNNGNLLKEIVGKINSLNPDIILLPGDIVDDKTKVLDRRNIGSAFENLKAKYGVYASTGNHEYISGIKQGVAYMERHNIKVIRDTAVNFDNKFYVAGREDRSKNNFTGQNRKTIEAVLEGIDKNLPVILLDHTPLDLEDAMNNDITLQLSGHTHHGQLFPVNLITSAIYEVSWGYLKKGNTQYYVTSGVGTWGPPVRTGSNSEIVNIKIKFE